MKNSNITKLVAISGSLRAASANTAVLRTLQETMSAKAEITLLPLDKLPLYNQDLDLPEALPAVAEFRAAIEAADGLVICTPEYNGGVSGVLKNALDWASRPTPTPPLKNKSVVIMSCSPGFTGAVRAQWQLRETLTSILSRVLVRPPVVIAAVHTKIKEGRLVDADSLKFAQDAVSDLIDEIAMLRRAKAQSLVQAELEASAVAA